MHNFKGNRDLDPDFHRGDGQSESVLIFAEWSIPQENLLGGLIRAFKQGSVYAWKYRLVS